MISWTDPLHTHLQNNNKNHKARGCTFLNVKSHELKKSPGTEFASLPEKFQILQRLQGANSSDTAGAAKAVMSTATSCPITVPRTTLPWSSAVAPTHLQQKDTWEAHVPPNKQLWQGRKDENTPRFKEMLLLPYLTVSQLTRWARPASIKGQIEAEWQCTCKPGTSGAWSHLPG